VGSEKEGWSIAMLEALACGKPIVSTAVSGATEMIAEGQNGFIVCNRDPVAFAGAMLRGLTLPSACPVSREIAQRYSSASLARDLRALWAPLR